MKPSENKFDLNKKESWKLLLESLFSLGSLQRLMPLIFAKLVGSFVRHKKKGRKIKMKMDQNRQIVSQSLKKDTRN
jgi:hypothetical protein